MKHYHWFGDVFTCHDRLVEGLIVKRVQQAALLEALEAMSAATEPIRAGERSGEVFGQLSNADDAARKAIASAREEQ